SAVLEFQQRHTAIRILREVIGSACRAVVQPIVLERKRNAELARSQSHLVAIAGHLHLVKNWHDRNPQRFLRSMPDSNCPTAPEFASHGAFDRGPERGTWLRCYALRAL